MQIRTYDAELVDPAVSSSGVSLTPVRRVRFRSIRLETAVGGFGFVTGGAEPARLLVSRGEERPTRKLLADRNAVVSTAVGAATKMLTRTIRRRRS